MDPAQAQIVMDTLDEIKAKMQDLTTKKQDQAQDKKKDHVEHQETLETMRIEGSHTQDILHKADSLIRELQETNGKQGKMISTLQRVFCELQDQMSPQVQETPILSSHVPKIKAEDQSDSDSELQETPILTPPTPVSKGAASRITILSHPSDTPSDFSTQAHNTLDRISKLLTPTGTLSRSDEPVIQETPILRSQEAQDTLQAKIASLEDAINSKTRQITEMEQDHEETIRLMSEQLDNAYSRLSPSSLNSTEIRDAQLETLEDRNMKLSRMILQNIDKAESTQNFQKKYIEELENEVAVLRVNNMEMIRLERELTEKEVRYAEISEKVANYRRWLDGVVFENIIEENLSLTNKCTSYEAAVKTLKDEMQNVIQRKSYRQEQVKLEESEKKSEEADK